MKPVYLCGRGLACTLGLDLQASLNTLRHGTVPATARELPGSMGSSFPYHTIPYQNNDWNARACELVQQVAQEAGLPQQITGALFIATSSFDIGAVKDTTPLAYNDFARKVAAWLAWTGPLYVISTACTSSINALLSAHAFLRAGDFEEALILGFELDNKITLGGFASLQLLSPGSSQPFGLHRDGLVLGEAVAALRLSTREISPWKLLGGANIVDGSQQTSASASAAASMYQRALAACGLSADAVDLVKVQAAGSPGNDDIEAQGLHTAFRKMPALVSLKAVLGHAMGASGAAEIALLTACLEHGVWPPQPTAEMDDTLGLSLAPCAPVSVRHLMATILGFGGGHATVALERA